MIAYLRKVKQRSGVMNTDILIFFSHNMRISVHHSGLAKMLILLEDLGIIVIKILFDATECV